MVNKYCVVYLKHYLGGKYKVETVVYKTFTISYRITPPIFTH